MPTRHPADLWRELVAEAGEDASEHAQGASAAQAERELRAAGFDVARERAKAGALLDGVAEGSAQASPEADALADPTAWVTKAEHRAPRATSARYWPLLLAATLAAATAGGVLYALGHRPKPIEPPVEVPRDAPTVTTPPPPRADVPSPSPSAPPVDPTEPRRRPNSEKGPR